MDSITNKNSSLKSQTQSVRKMIVQLDSVVFKGAIKRYLRQKGTDDRVDQLESGLDHKFVAYYKKNKKNLLADLCDRYGSDKGSIKTSGHLYPWAPHSYTDFYSMLFSHCRLHVKKVFECGLGTNDESIAPVKGLRRMPGASHRVWRDYFPNAEVIGADIDKKILFEEERIKTYYMDQTDPAAIQAFWRTVGLSDFDFMLDDGLHTFKAGSCLFENSISKLSESGIYIIEDVTTEDLLRYKEYFSKTDYSVDYVTMYRPNLNLADNNLIIIRRQ